MSSESMLVDPETGEFVELGSKEIGAAEGVVGLRGRVRVTMARYAEKLRRKRQLPTGEEVPDEVPMAPPIGYVRQKSMVEIIREQIRSAELARAAEEAGAETFEEADDFDVPDDLEPYSAYEMEEIFEPVRPASPPAASEVPDQVPPAAGPDASEPPTGG